MRFGRLFRFLYYQALKVVRFVLMIILALLVFLGMRAGAIPLAPIPSLTPTPSPTPIVPSTLYHLAAQEEGNAAARAYREGRFSEAEQHARKAVELEPLNKTWRMYVVRIVHAQYRPGVDTPENAAAGQKAVEEYRKAFEWYPMDVEIYKAVAYLYTALKEDEKFRDWVTAWANNSGIEASKRAEAYIVLASKDWDCSFKITELPVNKVTKVRYGRAATIVYKKPRDPKDFATAQKCVSRGLEEIENAITLDPNSESAWAYKTNLLLESSKLAEMENDSHQKAELDRQAEAARQRALQLKPEPSPPPRR